MTAVSRWKCPGPKILLFRDAVHHQHRRAPAFLAENTNQIDKQRDGFPTPSIRNLPSRFGFLAVVCFFFFLFFFWIGLTAVRSHSLLRVFVYSSLLLRAVTATVLY